MDLGIKVVWIFTLSAGLVSTAPLQGPRPTEKVKSPVEEELLSLPKSSASENVDVKAVESLGQAPYMVKTLSESISPGVGVPSSGMAPQLPAGAHGKLKISGYDEVFESPAIDLSPRAVAEYLILTGDFTGFDLALFDLIRARVLSPAEVQRYKEAVGLEYKQMLKQMLDAETSYLQAFNALYGLPTRNEAAAQTLLPNPAVVEEKTVRVAAVVGDRQGLSASQPDQVVAAQPATLNVERIVQANAGQVEMLNKDEDLELQTLLEWLDNEMRQEMENGGQQRVPHEQPQQVVVEEVEAVAKSPVAVEPAMHATAVAEETAPLPDSEADATRGSEAGAALQNRDNHGQMVIKDDPPQSGSDA